MNKLQPAVRTVPQLQAIFLLLRCVVPNKIITFAKYNKRSDMYQEIGKWFMDVAKYVTTAFILAKLFDKIETTYAFLIAVVFVILSFSIGLYFYNKKKQEESLWL